MPDNLTHQVESAATQWVKIISTFRTFLIVLKGNSLIIINIYIYILYTCLTLTVAKRDDSKLLKTLYDIPLILVY